MLKRGGTTLDDYLDKVEDNLLIKPTESGTEMMLTDSSDMNIQELHLYGKTEQASTTGVNLFDINDRLSFNSIFKVDEEGYITATIPANNTEDYQYYNFFTKKSNLVKANTNYLIICEVVKMPTTKCSIRLTSVDKSTPGQIDGNVTISGKASGLEINLMKTKSDMSDSESFTRGYFSTSPGFTENQIKFRVSVLEDTSITADTFKYEPYTGGMPSPNPDYPQGIVSVENPTVTIQGKNLYSIFENNSYGKKQLINGVTYTKNADGSLTIKGKATTTSRYNLITNQLSAKLFARHIDEQYTLKIFGLPSNCCYEVSFAGMRYGETKNTFTNVKENFKKRYTELRIPEGVTVSTTIYPMLVLGDTKSYIDNKFKELSDAIVASINKE